MEAIFQKREKFLLLLPSKCDMGMSNTPMINVTDALMHSSIIYQHQTKGNFFLIAAFTAFQN